MCPRALVVCAALPERKPATPGRALLWVSPSASLVPLPQRPARLVVVRDHPCQARVAGVHNGRRCREPRPAKRGPQEVIPTEVALAARTRRDGGLDTEVCMVAQQVRLHRAAHFVLPDASGTNRARALQQVYTWWQCKSVATGAHSGGTHSREAGRVDVVRTAVETTNVGSRVTAYLGHPARYTAQRLLSQRTILHREGVSERRDEA
jgi:hypothetical protein